MEAPKLPVLPAPTMESAGSRQPADVDALRSFERALAAGGPGAALRVLNARTRHRFTSIHRVSRTDLACLYSVDGEQDVSLEPRPLTPADGYSTIVAETQKPFFTEASEYDARLMSHAARISVASYIGVPLRDADGNVLGALCHHDARPRAAPPAELEVLARAGKLLSQWFADASRADGSDAAPAPRAQA